MSDLRQLEREAKQEAGKYPIPSGLDGHGYFFNRAGEEITMLEQSILARKEAYCRLSLTHLAEGRLRVSTVWLGMDHSFGKSERPLIYETMVFVERENDPLAELDLSCWRHASEDEALEGHADVVKLMAVAIKAFGLEGMTGNDVRSEP